MQRYIDADALIFKLKTQDYSGAPDTLEDWTPEDMTKSEIADIEHAPTADVVERKKGKWRRRLVDSGFNADWHCSECGWKTSLEDHGFNFCPNCGAEMKGEEDG